jgi:hypothetical protein
VWREFQERRDQAGFARHIVRPEQAPLAVRLLQAGLGSLRGAIGTPEQVIDLLERYQTAGIDQVIFVMQTGRTRHEHICEALELFAARVMPRFADGREEREALKAARLEPAIEAALARREPAITLGSPYLIDEQAELARLQPSGGQPFSGRRLADLARERALAGARGGVVKLLARLVEGATDAQLERRFSSPVAQRALFTGMARSFAPEAAGGFQGRLVYELTRPATGGSSLCWTIEVADGQASARSGAGPDAKLTLRVALADFMRMAAGTLDPAGALLEDRATFEGDLALAARLPEMFGAPSAY